MSVYISNPSAGSVYYTCANVAVGSTNQPKQTPGAATRLGADRTLLDDVKSVKANYNAGDSSIVLGDYVGSAHISGELAVTSVGLSGTNAGYTTTAAHNICVGDIVSIKDTNSLFSGIWKVKTAYTTTTFTTQQTTTSTEVAAAGTLKYQALATAYTCAKTNKGQYIMTRGGANTEYLAGVSGFTTLRSVGTPATGRNCRGLNKFYPSKEIKNCTAVASYYNFANGTFTGGYPALSTVVSLYTCANAQATELIDGAINGTASIPGELTYKTGAFLPTQDEYAPVATR